MVTSRIVEAAWSIAERTTIAAAWNGEKCNWEVVVPDHRRGRGLSKVEMASGSFYSGTSGIALFLATASSLNGSATVERAAIGALRHSLDWAKTRPITDFGLYGGRLGPAVVAVRIGHLTGSAESVSAGLSLLRPMQGRASNEKGLDFIGGAAGAIPALLQISRVCDDPIPLALAIELGEHLLETADRSEVGWSWGPRISRPPVRNLCGLAHGASGFGHAFCELYAATNDERMRQAAAMAFLYERRFFDERIGNWPDFRNAEISREIDDHGIDKLLKMWYDLETVPSYTPLYMNAWCHGAAGIALARIRGSKVLGNPIYKTEIDAAVKTTVRMLEERLPEQGNYSLCHGVFGNIETLWEATTLFEEHEHSGLVLDLAEEGCARFEQNARRWPCGTVGRAADPGLMLGEAGIGYALLRLAVNVPSILYFPIDGISELQASPAKDLVVDLSMPESSSRRWALFPAHVLERTLVLIKRVTGDVQDIRSELCDLDPVDVESVWSVLGKHMGSHGSRIAEMLADGSAPDRLLHEALTKFTDVNRLTLLREFPQRFDSPLLRGRRVMLAPHVDIVLCRWLWEEWINSPALPIDDVRPGTEFHLIRYTKGGFVRRPISGFAGSVLLALHGRPHTALSLANQLLPAGEKPDDLLAAVNAQLCEAWNGGLLVPDHYADEVPVDTAGSEAVAPMDDVDLLSRKCTDGNAQGSQAFRSAL